MPAGQRKRDRMLALEGKVRAASTSSEAHGRTEVPSSLEKRAESTPEENMETLQSTLPASQDIALITPSPFGSAMDAATSAMPVSGWCSAAVPWAGNIDGSLGCSSWGQVDNGLEGSALTTFGTHSTRCAMERLAVLTPSLPCYRHITISERGRPRPGAAQSGDSAIHFPR